MVTALHALIYSDDPAATRAFLRDVLGLPHVRAGDDEPAWLIFKTGPSETGVHPTQSTYGGSSHQLPRKHEISLMCDDIHATVAELKAKGAEFTQEIEDHGYGWVTMLALPGADPIQLYQPNHPLAYEL